MSRAAGTHGEALAAAYLRRRGFQLIGHSYHCRFGEIDLIAMDGKTLCFIEVKTRSNLSVGLPREFVTAQKQQRIRKTAAWYLAEKELECPVRFDVAEVYTGAGGQLEKIEYLEDAF